MAAPRIADHAKVHKLLAKGVTPAIAAAVAGVTTRRVYQIRGVQTPKPRITDALRQEIGRRRASGQTVRLIAAELHVSRGTVLRVAPTMRTPRGWTDEDVEYVRSRMANHNAGTICRELGRPRSSVDSVMRRLRLLKH